MRVGRKIARTPLGFNSLISLAASPMKPKCSKYLPRMIPVIKSSGLIGIYITLNVH